MTHAKTLSMVLFVFGAISFHQGALAQPENANSSVIYFDALPGKTDTEKLQQLPDLLRSKLQTIGVKYSQMGSWPQPNNRYTAIKILFAARVHDFRDVPEPVDMGHQFLFESEGRSIFECGPSGFIRFSHRLARFREIEFAGPRNNTPPLIIYSTGEPKKWKPSENSAQPGEKPNWSIVKAEPNEESAWGETDDGGDILIENCYFKGFGVAIRTRPGQHTAPGTFRVIGTVFYNVRQMSDYLVFDECTLEQSWFCPSMESDLPYIVNMDGLRIRDCTFTPQSEAGGNFKNMRWIDHYGWFLDIAGSRFGNESVNHNHALDGEQISLIYNYTKFLLPWTNPEKTHELENDKNYIVLRDNWLYARNVPLIKFFEIPNHVSITGNTGLTGNYKTLADGKEYDSSVLFEFIPTCTMPTLEMKPYILFHIFDNLRCQKITKNNPDYLPEPLCYFGPEIHGFKNQPR